MKELFKKNKRLVLLVAAVAMMFGLFIPAKQVMAAGVIQVTQTGVDKTSVDIAFTNVNDNATYEVYYSKQQDTGYLKSGNAYGSGKDNIEKTIYNLESGEVYYVVVKALNNNAVLATSQPYTVVTTPDASGCTMAQTGATKSSIDLTWTPAKGASGYYIYVGSNEPITVAGESYTVSNLAANTRYGIAIYPFKTNPMEPQKIAAGEYNYMSGYAYTTCAAPTELKVYSYKGSKATVQFYGSSKAASGYEIEVSALNGKKIKTYSVKDAYTYKFAFTNSKIKNKGFQYRVRSYYDMAGKRSYGDWSNKKVIIPMPQISAKKNTCVLKWTKVNGAKSYTIYKSSTLNGKYKKYKTVSSKTTSYDLGRFNGYVYVVANKVKAGKKSYDSTKPTSGCSVIHFYSYTRWF